MIFIDYSIIDDCQNLDHSYGEICVRCNRCGRFKKENIDDVEQRLDEILKEEFGED